ncbi:MAG TPA: hypothetical protein VJQ56_12700 [Blastocatellia bacterium]|nr:hypothetical protein [Blastocatellia bacterium]
MKRLVHSSRFAVLPLVLTMLVAGSSFIQADNGPNHKVRNLNFGVSGGNVRDISRRFCCSGTLGGLLQDAQGVQYVLSNNHVMGLAGAATAGDDISQPGLIDTGCRIATVVADFTASAPLSSNVDASIAQLRTGQMNATGFIEDIGVISSVVKNPAVGLQVQKSGRTTGHTTGASISSISATVSIKYPTECGGNKGPVFTFTNQVIINSSTFSAGGDSGSVILTTGTCPQPVALLFAGSSTSTIGNRMTDVINRLNTASGKSLSFVGVACGTALAMEQNEDTIPGIPRELIARAIDIKERNENRIMSKNSVIGMGVGAADDNPLEPVIHVYVDQTTGKKPRIPKKIEGLRVKVIYTDTFVAY